MRKPLDITLTFPKRANGALTREVGKLTLDNLTRGEMACIVNALADRASQVDRPRGSGSAIAHDIFLMLRDRAVDNGNWPEVAEFCHSDAEIAEARRGEVVDDPAHPRLAPGRYEFANTPEKSGLTLAHEFLQEHGYSWGPMQREAPIGIAHGDVIITKWRNLGEADMQVLDGVIKPFVVGWNNIEPTEGDKERGATMTVYGGAIVTIYGPDDVKEGCRPPSARK